MEKELDVNIIKATQASLGKFVKRPALTEKLLKRPPFRFLHDIITTVLKTTGFFEGLFDQEELISENVKDKESKIQFLNKVITVVGLATGKTISAKSSKIVAGQEAEKTNELLQCLAHALEQKISSQEAVKKYKEKAVGKIENKPQINNIRTSKNSKVKSDEKPITNPSINKNSLDSLHKTNSNEKIQSNKTKQKDTTSQSISNKKSQSISKKNQTHSKNTTQENDKLIISKNQTSLNGSDANPANTNLQSDLESKDEFQNENSTNHEHNGADINEDSNATLIQKELDIQEIESKQIAETTTKNNLEEDFLTPDVNKTNQLKEVNVLKSEQYDPAKLDDKDKKDNQNNSNKNKYKTDVNNEDIQNTLSTFALLNGKKETKNILVERPLSVRPSSSRPGAPRLKDKFDTVHSESTLTSKVHIIEENTHHDEDEEKSIIVVDNTNLDINESKENIQADENSHLVQQILDSQKEFSHGSGIEWLPGKRREERDAFCQEIEQVKLNIQSMSRIANPLGKLLDHIQEDVELMRQEKQNWIKMYEDVSKQLTKQKMTNDESLSSLKSKLKQLNLDIEEKHDKINDLKLAIHKYYMQIDKILSSGNM